MRVLPTCFELGKYISLVAVHPVTEKRGFLVGKLTAGMTTLLLQAMPTGSNPLVPLLTKIPPFGIEFYVQVPFHSSLHTPWLAHACLVQSLHIRLFLPCFGTVKKDLKDMPVQCSLKKKKKGRKKCLSCDKAFSFIILATVFSGL